MISIGLLLVKLTWLHRFLCIGSREDAMREVEDVSGGALVFRYTPFTVAYLAQLQL